MNTMIDTLKRATAPAVFALLVLGLPEITSAAEYPEPGSFAQGSKAWADNCVRCHNMRDPQDLRDDQWITTAFHMRVRAGLTGQQVRDILTFLQGSNSVASAAPELTAAVATEPAGAASGEAVFRQTCIACHGENGKGVVPGAPDLTRSDGPLAQSDEVVIRHIIEGFQSPGSPMAMPPKGGNPALTQADIEAVLAYMRERFRQ